MKKFDLTLLILVAFLIGAYIAGQRPDVKTPSDPVDINIQWEQAHAEQVLNSACQDGDVKVYFVSYKTNVNDRIFVPIVAWPGYHADSIAIK